MKITWYYPGVIAPETSTVEVDEDFIIPKTTYAYKIEGEKGMHYIGGQVYTYEELCKAYPNKDHRILRSNVKQFKATIKTRIGNFQPFDPDKDYYVSREELERRNFVEEL